MAGACVSRAQVERQVWVGSTLWHSGLAAGGTRVVEAGERC